VQRLPVRIAINADELQKHPLRIGLSMDAEVNLHNQNGPILSRNAPAKPVLSTDVYQRSSKQADALIAKIVAENSEGPATGSKSGTGAN